MLLKWKWSRHWKTQLFLWRGSNNSTHTDCDENWPEEGISVLWKILGGWRFVSSHAETECWRGGTSGKTEQLVSASPPPPKCGSSPAGGCWACWPAAWPAGSQAGKKLARLANWSGSRERLPSEEAWRNSQGIFFFVLLNQHFYWNIIDQL